MHKKYNFCIYWTKQWTMHFMIIFSATFWLPIFITSVFVWVSFKQSLKNTQPQIFWSLVLCPLHTHKRFVIKTVKVTSRNIMSHVHYIFYLLHNFHIISFLHRPLALSFHKIMLFLVTHASSSLTHHYHPSNVPIKNCWLVSSSSSASNLTKNKSEEKRKHIANT